jgi:hypothetical protein
MHDEGQTAFSQPLPEPCRGTVVSVLKDEAGL